MYFARDTHWTPFGALIAMRRLIDSLDPGLWDEREMQVDGFASYATDLSRLMGTPTLERMPKLLVRPGVEMTVTTVPTEIHLRNARAIPWYHVPSDVPAVEGRTLMVYDSFFGTSQAPIARWFRETVWVHYNDLFYYPKLAADLPKFDRIVLERVEQRAHDVDIEGLLAPLVKAAGAAD